MAFLLESDEIPERVDVVGAAADLQDVYSERRGEIHVVDGDGETDVALLREDHPEIESRVERRREH